MRVRLWKCNRGGYEFLDHVASIVRIDNHASIGSFLSVRAPRRSRSHAVSQPLTFATAAPALLFAYVITSSVKACPLREVRRRSAAKVEPAAGLRRQGAGNRRN